VVINCLCHENGLVPPNVNTIDSLRTSKVQISSQVANRPVRRSIVHAAGFGGPTAVVALSGIGID
jgi:hypothetical protein